MASLFLERRLFLPSFARVALFCVTAGWSGAIFVLCCCSVPETSVYLVLPSFSFGQESGSYLVWPQNSELPKLIRVPGGRLTLIGPFRPLEMRSCLLTGVPKLKNPTWRWLRPTCAGRRSLTFDWSSFNSINSSPPNQILACAFQLNSRTRSAGF